MSVSHQLDQRMNFMRFDHRQRDALRAAKPVVDAGIQKALDGFYSQLRAFPETSGLVQSGRGEGAQARQAAHWRDMATGDYGPAYAEAVERIGQSNARAGLEPRWSIGGYALVLEDLLRGVISKRAKTGLFAAKGADAETADQVVALTKAVFLDMDLVISSYFAVLQGERERFETERDAAQRQQAAAVAAVGEALSRLAAGDLSARVEAVMSPEFQGLKDDFDQAAASLSNAMKAVERSTDGIRAGADEIAQAADDLAQRTEQQASTLQQTASAVGQLTTTVGRTAKSAREVSERVSEAAEEAQRSGAVVTRAAEAMTKIEASSNQVNQILGVIDEIAFQDRKSVV